MCLSQSLMFSYWQGGQAVYLGQYFNSKKGFKSILRTLSKLTEISIEKWFICFENTGSYSKALFLLVDRSINTLPGR